MAFGAVAVYSLIGNGFSIRNRTARQEAERLLQVWREDGTEAFVNQMEPEKAYEALCTPVVSFLDRSDDISYGGDGRQIPSKLEVAFPEGNSEQKYMVEDISLIQDLIDDGMAASEGKFTGKRGWMPMFTGLWLPARQRRWRTRPATTF